MQKRITIVDVARHAKVSLGTASKALNNPDQVGTKRLARVLKAIEDLGYTRNMLAQGLRAKRSSAIGLCVPHSRVSFFSALIYRFEELAFGQNQQIMLVLSHGSGTRELNAVKMLASYGVDGLLLVPSAEPKAALDYLHSQKIPTVIVNRPVDLDERFDQVVADNRDLMVNLTSDLISLGHRRILLATRSRSATVTVHRVAGLQEAQRNAKSRVRTQVIESSDDQAEFGRRMDTVLQDFSPTAIVTGNDVIAAWTMRELQKRGIKIPADISLATFDEPPWAEIVTPPMTTVRLAVNDMATHAWKRLLARMDDMDGLRSHFVVPAEIKYRASVAAPPRSENARRTARSTSGRSLWDDHPQ